MKTPKISSLERESGGKAINSQLEATQVRAVNKAQKIIRDRLVSRNFFSIKNGTSMISVKVIPLAAKNFRD